MEFTAQIKTFKLSQLTGSIERMFSQHLRDKHFWVVAEVTDCTFQKNNGRRYFALVEKKKDSSEILAKIQAVVWESAARKIDEFEKTTGQKFQSGLQVLVKVSVHYHSNYGLKLHVVDISSEFTIGNLARQREDTLNRLVRDCPAFIRKIGEHYRTFNQSLTWQPVIQKIALVTSNTAAGYEDFINTLEHNPFGYRFRIDKYYTPVQGEANATALCNKLDAICASKVSYDAVIIIRGGGSQTDFLIFDNYELCKTIARFPFPVITGIGHLRNESIADLMAHTVAKTPTEAAEKILAHNNGFENALLDLKSKIANMSKTIVATKMLQLSRLQSLIANQSKDLISWHKGEQTDIQQAITSAAQKMLYDKRFELQSAMGCLMASQKLVIIHRQNELAALICKVKLSSKSFHLKQQAHLCMLSQQVAFQNKQIIKDHQKELSKLSVSIRTNSEKFLAGQSKSLDNFVSILRVMSPANILRRGFAIVFHGDNIMTNGASIPDGSEIRIRFSDTIVESITKNKNKTNDRKYFI